MLKRNDLIKELGAEYTDMISQVSIPDFTKCIAQYSGISIQDLKDDIIKEYLTKWARNKLHLFHMLDNKLKVDMPIVYKDESKDYDDKLLMIGKDYPAYYPWIKLFKSVVSNKIDCNALLYSEVDFLREVFPSYKFDGVSLTHFFKSKLNAPDELVTAIGRVFENNEVNATFTISIDPIDIMLSSENPYNWSSCYRLEDNFEESHADGCLAGILDDKTLITYVWTKEGKYELYGNYDFKKIRYKMMRMTIALNRTFNAIHFNEIYPGKGNLSEGLHKLFRDKVETYIAEKTGKKNTWMKKLDIRCDREHCEYGYGEYDEYKVWAIKGEKEYGDLMVYNETITCPCGCGEDYIGSENENEYWYNGQGHVNENYQEEGYYCEYTDEREDCDGDCRNCSIWARNNMVCELDEDERCDRDPWEAEDDGDFDPYRGNVVSCNPEHCEGCPLYKLHHPEEDEDEEEENNEEQTDMVTIVESVDRDGNIFTITSPFPNNIENQYYTYYTSPEAPNNLRVEVDGRRWRPIPGEWYNDNDNN